MGSAVAFKARAAALMDRAVMFQRSGSEQLSECLKWRPMMARAVTVVNRRHGEPGSQPGGRAGRLGGREGSG